MIDEVSIEEMAALVRTLADVAERVRAGVGDTEASLFDAGAGPFDSFSAVIDGLADDLDLPRPEVVGCLIGTMRRQIATDHAVLALLVTLEGQERRARRNGKRQSRGQGSG